MNIRGPHPGVIEVEPVAVMIGNPAPGIVVNPDRFVLPVIPISCSIRSPACRNITRLPGPIVIATVKNPVPVPVRFQDISVFLHGFRQMF